MLVDGLQVNRFDRFSNIALPFVIGLSSRQSPLVGIRISGNVRLGQDTLKPQVRLVSNLAGDEATGRELLTHFALHLLHQYNKDPLVTALVDTTDIAILPTLNPDGFEESRKGSCSGARNRRGQLNANNVELTKSFPTFEEKEKFENDVHFDPYSGREIHKMGAAEPLTSSYQQGIRDSRHDELDCREQVRGWSRLTRRICWSHISLLFQTQSKPPAGY